MNDYFVLLINTKTFKSYYDRYVFMSADELKNYFDEEPDLRLIKAWLIDKEVTL